MNEHKFHTGKVMKSTPGRKGRGTKPNRKHVLLRTLAELKRKQYDELKKSGKINQNIPNDLEHWLFMYSDYTEARLKNELLNLGNPLQ